MFTLVGGSCDMQVAQTKVLTCAPGEVAGYEKLLLEGNFALGSLPDATYDVRCKMVYSPNVTNDPIRLYVGIAGFPVDAVIASLRATNWRAKVVIAGVATYDIPLYTFNDTLYYYYNVVASTSSVHDCSSGVEPAWTNLVTGDTYTTTIRFYQG